MASLGGQDVCAVRAPERNASLENTPDGQSEYLSSEFKVSPGVKVPHISQ